MFSPDLCTNHRSCWNRIYAPKRTVPFDTLYMILGEMAMGRGIEKKGDYGKMTLK